MSAVREPVRARQAMVIAQQPADEAGLAVLRKGGNAIDAAIAIGFALNAAYPYAGALGGGGFMLIRLANGRTTFIDFREQAPAAATRTMYLDAQGNLTRDSIEGWRSSGVPGTVRGFELAHKKYAKLSWAADMAPAIELATKGFTVSYAFAEQLRGSRSLARDPESTRIWLKGGRFYEQGDRMVLPDLAQDADAHREERARRVLHGRDRSDVRGGHEGHGGLITMADLAAYKAVERAPLTGTYRNYTVIASPPPSSGGVGLLQMLGMLDGTGYEKTGSSVVRHDALPRGSHAPLLRRSQRVPRGPGLREEPDRETPRHEHTSRRVARRSISRRQRPARRSAPG